MVECLSTRWSLRIWLRVHRTGRRGRQGRHGRGRRIDVFGRTDRRPVKFLGGIIVDRRSSNWRDVKAAGLIWNGSLGPEFRWSKMIWVRPSRVMRWVGMGMIRVRPFIFGPGRRRIASHVFALGGVRLLKPGCTFGIPRNTSSRRWSARANMQGRRRLRLHICCSRYLYSVLVPSSQVGLLIFGGFGLDLLSVQSELFQGRDLCTNSIACCFE